MNWNKSLRQLHRWLSIAFTLAVIANLSFLPWRQPPVWVGLMALFPLILLMLSGLYLFALPYTSAWRRPHRAGAGE
ncbi:hypothetical protein [Sphingosinicella sp. BN140058]|uniref:hypothetical protein n=1 Tax=Sphingosinicella sp. BN140058 TaxID=1892855 RepID=UPI001011D57D|nr:hypothetical protein [Sphingosinicella sp. BN140058]QAY75344.1 hypothetical protein ETR14_01470 [Sphingosinicella sp. BN140058]